MIKYSNAELLSIDYLKTKNDTRKYASKIAKVKGFDYNPEEGFLYVNLRAISSRCNGNGDGFPPFELEAHWETYRGCPNFIEHENQNFRKARGVVVDAIFHPDDAPKELLAEMESSFNSKQQYNPVIWTPDSHLKSYASYEDKDIVNYKKDNWIELLVEIDAVNFPKYAKALIDGVVDRFSMGCDVQYSICSVCGNVAKTEFDYCDHINNYKNQWIEKEGKKILAFEDNREIAFFEISAVRDPADPSALLIEFDNSLSNNELKAVAAACKKIIGFLIENNIKTDNVIELSREVSKKDIDFKKVAMLVDSIKKSI